MQSTNMNKCTFLIDLDSCGKKSGW